jgi:cytochrome c oxidase cbb3-type subunit 3
VNVRAGVVLAVVLLTSCEGSAPRGGVAGGRDASAPPSVRYAQHLAAGGALPPGDSLVNPFAKEPRSAAEGEKLFSAMNCDGCHGGGAVGWVGPSLIDGRWRYGGADAAVFQSIYYGRPQGMPAFGGMLSSDLIWKLVSYLRSLPPPRAVPTQAW